MASPADLTGWAIRILDYLDESGISVSSTVSWLQNNLYRINLAIGSGFYTESGYILPEMSPTVSGLYENQYYCFYYNKKANSTVGAFAYDWTSIEGADQGSIRRVSKNEVAKTYRSLATDCQAALADMVKAYNEGDVTALGQILWGWRGEVAGNDLLCPCEPTFPSHCGEDTPYERR